MSYSMSPPNGAPRPAYPNSASPPNANPYGPPPPKRQRMSTSPPNGVAWAPPANAYNYGNTYAPNSPYTPQPPNFNTPQAYASPWQSQPPTPAQRMSPTSREMPPPPRPRDEKEDKVGVEEIGDSLFGSGINLKDEENYVQAIYNNRHPPTHDGSFSSFQNSFGSSVTAGGSFTQGTDQTAFSGTLGPTQTEEQVELEQRRKREAAARERAERRQHHLNNQFLQCNNVRKRMDNIARDYHVSIIMNGVFIRQPETSVMVNGNGNEGVVATKEDSRPESVVNQNTPFEGIVSLISLAAGERIRGLLDEAFTLARTRCYGDHGRVVPPDFADIATGEGKRMDETVTPENITGTPWDRIPDSELNEDGTPQPVSTISFSGALNASLRAIAERDRAAEKARLARREARKRKADTAASSATPPAETQDLTASAEAPKLTKKEAQRQAKEKNSSTEAQLHLSTNQTAAMMMLGKKGRQYDWMSGGAGALPTNRFAKTSGTATPTKVASEGPSAAVTPGEGGIGAAGIGAGVAVGETVKWGEWRENGKKEIEMRDWILVLERDGREGKSLVKAMNRLDGSKT